MSILVPAYRLRGGLPPGPPLPPLVQTLLEVYAPRPFVAACCRRYGGVFTIQSLGRPPVVVLAAPEAVRKLFTVSGRMLTVGRLNRLMEPLVGRRSVFVADGEEHRQLRRTLLTGLSGSALAGKEEVIAEATLEAIAGLRPGDEVSALDLAERVTLCVVVEMLFGAWRGEPYATLRQRLRGMFGDLQALWKSWTLLVPGFLDRLAFVPALRRVRENTQAVQAMLQERIAAARAGGAAPGSLLAALLAARSGDRPAFDDEMIRDQVMTVLAAGYETTAVAVAWALYRIHRDPPVLRRLQEDLARGDHAYLLAVCQETLRLDPPVSSGLVRELHEPLEVGGWTLPAGTRALAWMQLVQHDPAVHPEPRRFLPDRFLGQGGRGPDRPDSMPFGGGHRVCVGQAQSLLAMRTILATLLSGLRLSLASDRPVRAGRRGLVMVPVPEVRLRVEAKLGRSADGRDRLGA